MRVPLARKTRPQRRVNRHCARSRPRTSHPRGRCRRGPGCAAGNLAEAHAFLAVTLKETQPLEAFTAAVRARPSLFDVADTSYSSRALDTSGATLEGTATLRAGTTVPISFSRHRIVRRPLEGRQVRVHADRPLEQRVIADRVGPNGYTMAGVAAPVGSPVAAAAGVR